jgi:crotonobetainyl-CoA:carnitine CoA-transferase CaiB-like acyl-CoA transferase
VLDLTQMLAGPYATMLLADLGADVVKIEPVSGDSIRAQGPYLPDDQLRAYGGYFQSVNRSKRSLALDLKNERGRDVLRQLAADADVLVENFRVGVMDRLRLSYESLQEANPRLVYTAIRGFGDPRTGASPYADWPAFDVVAQAMGGFMAITGPGPGQPTKAGPGVGDIFPAALAAVGTLAALLHARETGEGQFVDVAMYDGVLSLCEREVYLRSYLDEVLEPQGNGHPLFCPFDVFPSADGHLTIAAPHDHHWRRLCVALGRPELAEDDRFSTNPARVAHGAEVRELVAGWTRQHTNHELMRMLAGRVPAGPVNDAADIANDPHVAAREMLIDLEHPGSAGTAAVAGVPIKMTGTKPPKPTRAPLLSEHANTVLFQAGISEDEIHDLRAAGVVG